MSNKELTVADILTSIKAIDEHHYRWILEQIKRGEEEAQQEDYNQE